MIDVKVSELQAYLANHYGDRVNEQSMFMKLVEEVGEVAEVLNQRAGRKASDGYDLSTQLAEELADVIHYTVALAAVSGIDLTETILSKDEQASIKYGRDQNLRAFLEQQTSHSSLDKLS